ncbi:MAG: AraC family transcriptional regulator [Chitinophagales bacterium]|nr:AraC family transcriptional regulator [Chitinophagales bacterium]
MQTFEYTHTNFEELLKYFAKNFNSKVKGNKIIIPEDKGNGYIKYISLANSLQVLISNYTLKQDTLFQRKKTQDAFFILRFEDISIEDTSKNNEDDQSKSIAVLTSTKFDWMFYAKENTPVRTINILLSKQWLDNFLDTEKRTEYIKKYLSLKISSFNYESLDSEYKRIMNEMMQCNDDTPFEHLAIANRAMLLFERFFTRIYNKINNETHQVKVSEDDFQRLVIVEAELVKDFSEPAPGIPKLARMAAMSSSKLKMIFRDIYGLPIYQYYQKHRMNKAKAMLLSQKYTVREVGESIGYSNLSNFAKAFKKSFDQLPSDLLHMD